MNEYLSNWKTTAPGVALLALAVLEFLGVRIPGVPNDPGVLIMQGLAGLGLVAAKDANK